jgi:glycosyltransferase involved in cell wall biosynthesis
MSTKPKVLLILQLPPPIHGASLTGLNIQNSKIINSDLDCTFVRISTKSLNYEGFIFQLVNLLALYAKVIGKLTTNRFILVYITPCTSGFFPFYKDFGICLLAKAMCRRVVYHFHDKGISTNKYVPSFLLRLYFKNVRIILSSKKLFYDVRQYVEEEHVYYCPYGERDADIDVNFGPKPASTPTILFLAHMLRSKGVFDLLEACAILASQGLQFNCDFVGTWYDIQPEEFDSFVKERKLEKTVKFLGPQYGSDKNKVLSHSDIFCLPTFYPMECFPLIILDAMRWRLPVVSTSEGAISEIIDDGKTGFIVNKNSPSELADRISTLIKDSDLRERLGAAARAKFEKNYTFDRFEINLKGILFDALKR